LFSPDGVAGSKGKETLCEGKELGGSPKERHVFVWGSHGGARALWFVGKERGGVLSKGETGCLSPKGKKGAWEGGKAKEGEKKGGVTNALILKMTIVVGEKKRNDRREVVQLEGVETHAGGE